MSDPNASKVQTIDGSCTASELSAASNQCKSDKLCRATQLWHGIYSNVVLLLRETKFINHIVFWRDCVPTGS